MAKPKLPFHRTKAARSGMLFILVFSFMGLSRRGTAAVPSPTHSATPPASVTPTPSRTPSGPWPSASPSGTISPTFTCTPTFSCSPTATDTPCDLLYKGHFGRQTPGVSLDTLGYTTITAASAKDWSIVTEPATGKAAAAPTGQGGWHFVKYGAASEDYIDFHATLDAGPAAARNSAYLFW
ncbi:MAG TPA: hypothetical protein VNZ54_01135, partial [bacterium]|nr:hypothetical protein [bacterium]